MKEVYGIALDKKLWAEFIRYCSEVDRSYEEVIEDFINQILKDDCDEN